MGTFLQKTTKTQASATPNPLWHPPSSSLQMLRYLHCPGTRFKSRWSQPRYTPNYPSTMVRKK